MPLALIIDGANRMACALVEATLDHLMITRPPLTEEGPQHMCLDAGDDYDAISVTLQAHQDKPHS
jgi:putative transposase